MKKKFLFLLIFYSMNISAQKISGIYVGTLYNDSTKKVQNYELALSEYKGKITGYSYVTFVSNDTFYYGIRKIKAKIAGDSLIVEDDKMLVNNFPESPAKHVNRIVTIPLNGQDSLVSLTGRWKTNQTKIYYSVPGSIKANKTGDSSGSALIAHLKELNIIGNDTYQNTDAQAKRNKVKVKTSSVSKLIPVKKEDVVLSYDQRKNKLLQTIDVSSDSLVLSFYDNGVVDGDSISVYINGKNIVSHSRLLATATRKTISLSNFGNELLLLLVAENLGTIPPNTGLLVISDGKNTYQINFSTDMQTNASIMIKRNMKQ